MKIFCKFLTVHISKLNFWLVICIANNFIWTTLKMIFSIFSFFCTLRFQIFKYLYLGQILSYHNKPYINGKLIYSAFRWCIHLNFEKLTLKTGFVVQGHICNVFLWSKLYFQHHYSSLQCHMIFRNHNNILICCSGNISDYYQCWKQLCCTILFLWKLWYIYFFRIHRWIESSEEQHLFETEIFLTF